jgi:hypothetical protein
LLGIFGFSARLTGGGRLVLLGVLGFEVFEGRFSAWMDSLNAEFGVVGRLEKGTVGLVDSFPPCSGDRFRRRSKVIVLCPSCGTSAPLGGDRGESTVSVGGNRGEEGMLRDWGRFLWP